MPSKSQDWSALASHNERVVTGPSGLPVTLADTDTQPRSSRARTAQVRSRLKLRKRAGRTGTAARA
jgi:hypothetical protein